MEVRALGLEGVLEITPDRHGDSRGFFSETYNKSRWEKAGLQFEFVQDNYSYSADRGVLRGLHYQIPPRAQDKLVRVCRGSILDLAVDIRRSSATFGHWISLVVSAGAWNQVLVPKGFAHGFLTLEDDTEVVYKVTDYYSPQHDRAIRFDDPDINIAWPADITDFILSDKDREAPFLAEAETF
ncbi:dTDP-4-dehydrorhamnose 3,5-epimerase [Hoeflea sp.]|uniref:dTDP-4-dehydrorhamnose 3,5-epimerase n=1 Tax=Hoeflea sp. TaxID=1940281 RepID=UPI003B0180CE